MEAARYSSSSPVNQLTNAIAKPSYPLLPTVWITVALTRGSAASSSFKRRIQHWVRWDKEISDITIDCGPVFLIL